MDIYNIVKQEREFVNLLMEDALEKAMEWIGKHKSPEDVFSEQDLTRWAEENGFVREEEARAA